MWLIRWSMLEMQSFAFFNNVLVKLCRPPLNEIQCNDFIIFSFLNLLNLHLLLYICWKYINSLAGNYLLLTLHLSQKYFIIIAEAINSAQKFICFLIAIDFISQEREVVLCSKKQLAH